MATLQDIVDLARDPLNDDDADDSLRRWPDTKLLQYAVAGLLHAFRARPDLWIGSFSTPPSLSMTLGSTFPLDDQFVQVIADYVTARAEAKDDEHVDSGRAAAYMNLFGTVVPV